MRAIRTVTTLTAAFLAGFILALGVASHAYHPRGCTFDGGGYIVSGDAARTDTGVWGCADGQLYHLAR